MQFQHPARLIKRHKEKFVRSSHFILIAVTVVFGVVVVIAIPVQQKMLSKSIVYHREFYYKNIHSPQSLGFPTKTHTDDCLVLF